MDDKTIELIGMRLADRAYAYRVFHIVFGAEPSADELEMLASEQTAGVLARLADASEAGAGSVKTWNQGDEANVSRSEALGRMAQLGEVLGGRLKGDAAYSDQLKAQFNKLFMVPGESYVYPWESPYLGKDATLFKQSTLDVRERYAKFGFEAQLKGHFPEDHISMMMQVLANVSDEAYEAFGNGDDARVRELLGGQQAFALAHLGEWLDDFSEELCRKDEPGVFFQAAESMRAFIAADVDFVGGLLSSGALGE